MDFSRVYVVLGEIQDMEGFFEIKLQALDPLLFWSWGVESFSSRSLGRQDRCFSSASMLSLILSTTEGLLRARMRDDIRSERSVKSMKHDDVSGKCRWHSWESNRSIKMVYKGQNLKLCFSF
ncbi:hypothetical protein SUGI_1056300 [Cryptomeria japonica]|nr:hypothetical protein SUGI_1056300 [Cryptomeria japonica]